MVTVVAMVIPDLGMNTLLKIGTTNVGFLGMCAPPETTVAAGVFISKVTANPIVSQN